MIINENKFAIFNILNIKYKYTNIKNDNKEF